MPDDPTIKGAICLRGRLVVALSLAVFVVPAWYVASAAGQTAPTTTVGVPPSAQRCQQTIDFYRRITVEDYQRVGKRNPAWDDHAQRALQALAALLALEFRPEADEYDIMFDSGRRAQDSGCNDPLVLFALARGHAYFNRKYEEIVPIHVESAMRIADSGYHPLLKCMVNLRAAAMRGKSKTDARAARRDARRMLATANAVLPAALADEQIPIDALVTLFDLIGDASAVVERDRTEAFNVAMAMLEQQARRQPQRLGAGLLAVIRGRMLLEHALDAARAAQAQPDTPEVAQIHQQRLADALAAAQHAWQIDPHNPLAAELMMSVQVARGKIPDAIGVWFDRAVAVDPDFLRVYAAKLSLLQPGQSPHGSIAAMIEFGRQCLAGGRWESGIPLLLVEAHLQAASLDEQGRAIDTLRREYFTSDPHIWQDIQAVYEPYLQRYPKSLYHRSRYAQLAAWCGQWSQADRQLRAMGDRFSLTWFRSAQQYRSLRSEVAEHVASDAEAPSRLPDSQFNSMRNDSGR
ncbi:hypothetical protein [Fontivita pretiosa]|uniref:hypothetical protein n=1 Tax=Fontivita pretiosa TaxID=2989684 RepID=UPI003D164F17